MIDRSLAHPAHHLPTPDYVWRGRGLFETYREELEYIGGGTWLIPSGSNLTKGYEVRVGTRPERCRCECMGYHNHGHCSHLVCAKMAHRRSAVCDCCGKRRWWSELTEVREEDELLAWFPGDRLCAHCTPGHWA